MLKNKWQEELILELVTEKLAVICTFTFAKSRSKNY